MNTKDTHSEDKPRNIDQDEVNFVPHSKKIKAQEKVAIKESGFGREQGQIPADEHIENLSQISKETIALQNEMLAQEDSKKKNDDEDNTINEVDDRDHGNSVKDWNAENNKSGRHK